MTERLYWLPLALLVACFNPQFSGEGVFLCRHDAGTCPGGYVCNAEKRCVSAQGGTTHDGGAPRDFTPVQPEAGPTPDLTIDSTPTPKACTTIGSPELIVDNITRQATFGFDIDESNSNDDLVLAYIDSTNGVNLAVRPAPSGPWAVYPITTPGTDPSLLGAGAVGVNQFNGSWVVVYYAQSNEIYAANKTGRMLLANNTTPSLGLAMTLRASNDDLAVAVWPSGKNVQIVGIDRNSLALDEFLDIPVGTGNASSHIAIDTDRAAKETHIGYLDLDNKLFYTRWTAAENKWLYSVTSIATVANTPGNVTGLDVLSQQGRHFVYAGPGPTLKYSKDGSGDEKDLLAGGLPIVPGGRPSIAGIGQMQGVAVIGSQGGNVLLSARKDSNASWEQPLLISKGSLNVDILHQVKLVASKGATSSDVLFHVAIIGELNGKQVNYLYNQPVQCSFGVSGTR